jgi:hypothetical protein
MTVCVLCMYVLLCSNLNRDNWGTHANSIPWHSIYVWYSLTGAYLLVVGANDVALLFAVSAHACDLKRGGTGETKTEAKRIFKMC